MLLLFFIWHFYKLLNKQNLTYSGYVIEFWSDYRTCSLTMNKEPWPLLNIPYNYMKMWSSFLCLRCLCGNNTNKNNYVIFIWLKYYNNMINDVVIVWLNLNVIESVLNVFHHLTLFLITLVIYFLSFLILMIHLRLV